MLNRPAQQRSITRPGWRVGLFLAFLAAPSGQSAFGCLAHYFSPEFLVGQSPLIIVGEVEKITSSKQKPAKGQATDRTGFTVATVRIQRVLKGRYRADRIQIRSGPVASCNPDPVYYPLRTGQQSIFILPVSPQKGESFLVYSGSVLDLSDVTMVQSRIDHADAFRAHYLDTIRTHQPDIYDEAIRLAGTMGVLSKHWPRLSLEEKAFELNPVSIFHQNNNSALYLEATESEAFTRAVADVVNRLKHQRLEAIRTAQALEWTSEDPKCWSRCTVWRSALRQLCHMRGKELAQAEQERLGHKLGGLGIAQNLVDAYLASLNPLMDLDLTLGFPPSPPPASRNTQQDPKNLTTEFILRYHAYDRGAMFQAYGMGFTALASLDPDRVEGVISAMFGSDDGMVRRVAEDAIQMIPGTVFVELVLDELISSRDRTHAWEALIHPDNAQETKCRLAALTDMAKRQCDDWSLAFFWDNLRKSGCFHEVCLRKAILQLEDLETKGLLSNSQVQLSESLQHYLSAALHEKERGDESTRKAVLFRKLLNLNNPTTQE